MQVDRHGNINRNTTGRRFDGALRTQLPECQTPLSTCHKQDNTHRCMCMNQLKHNEAAVAGTAATTTAATRRAFGSKGLPTRLPERQVPASRHAGREVAQQTTQHTTSVCATAHLNGTGCMQPASSGPAVTNTIASDINRAVEPVVWPVKEVKMV